MHTLRTQRRIEFADTDMAGIVHFARFFVFMESAEHEFMRAIGCSVHFHHEGRDYGWPRLEARCRYKRPIRFGDEVDIIVRVQRKGRRAMTYRVTFELDGQKVAEGEISSSCCVLETDDNGATRLVPVEIPSFLAEQIEEAPKE